MLRIQPSTDAMSYINVESSRECFFSIEDTYAAAAAAKLFTFTAWQANLFDPL